MGLNIFSRNSLHQTEGHLIETIRLAKGGDLAAFNRLVMEYQDIAYNLARWTLGADQTAEEATQSAFIQAYQGLGRFQSGSFRAWLLHFVVKNCNQRLRRAANGNSQALKTTRLNRGDHPDALVASLNPELRMAVGLVDAEGLECEEVAAILGMPVARLNRILAQARLALTTQH